MGIENEKNDYQTKTPKQGGIKMKRLLISMTILALLVVPQVALGSDVDDLKAVDEKAVKLGFSLDPNDTEAYVNGYHKEFISIDPNYAFPRVLTREQLRQGRVADIANIESRSWIEADALYHVVGSTGIISKYGTSVVKPKGAPVVIRNLRYSITFVKIDGKWLVYAIHTSVIPSGN